ncbi:MAG: hypothetical protein IJN74_06880 [Clostridia bacterium]|nr:hypothetical protein [Clostridia bacterium]
MYENIGEKIKTLAMTIAAIIAGIGALAGLVLMRSNPIFGVLIIVAVAIIAWVSSLVLYGFGELITKVSILAGGKSTTPGTTGVAMRNGIMNIPKR